MLSGRGNTSNIQQHYMSGHRAPLSTKDLGVQYSKDYGDNSISIRAVNPQSSRHPWFDILKIVH